MRGMLELALVVIILCLLLLTGYSCRVVDGPTMMFPSADSFMAACNKIENKCMPLEDETLICHCAINDNWDGGYHCDDCELYRF